MRRMSYVSGAIAASALLLCAACSGDEPTSTVAPTNTTIVAPSPTTSDPEEKSAAADEAALAAVTISGELGKVPVFDFTPPLIVQADVARVAQPGTGDEVAAGDAVTVLMATVNGVDGTPQGNEVAALPEHLLANEAAFPPALLDVLIGERVGARLLYATPDDAGGSLVYSFEIMSTTTVLSRAEGTPATPAPGLPVVTLAAEGRPSITPVEGTPPTALVTQPLIVGEGAALAADSSMVVHYSAWLWDGTEVMATWAMGSPYAMPLVEAHEGWQQALVGQTVGSQVLLVVPPELALGDEEVDGVPAGSTLIFVIDILAVM